MLRTPLLPIDRLEAWGAGLEAPAADGASLEEVLERDRQRLTGRLRVLLTSPVVREALLVASPSLDDAISRWLERGAAPRRLPEVLARYFARMASRPTPFGLFAGTSLARFGSACDVALAPSADYRCRTRLDARYLWALSSELSRDPALRGAIVSRPSSGIYGRGDELRHFERRSDEGGHALVSIEGTSALRRTLELAADGLTPEELSRLLAADEGVSHDEARAFVDALIDAQLLVSDLEPAVTGPPPLEGMLATLASCGSAGAVPARVLSAVRAELDAMDQGGLGRPRARYEGVANRLAELPAPVDAPLFHVQMQKPVERATIGPLIIEELARAADLCMSIAPPPGHEALRRFRERFAARYQAEHTRREVPLMEVLDEEAGIGFGEVMTGTAPLLEGLGRAPAGAEALASAAGSPAWRPADAWRLRRVVETLQAGGDEWELDALDLRRLATEPAAPPPDALAVRATVLGASAAAVDAGAFRVLIHEVGGPSGALLLGRFCHGDEPLHELVRAHSRAEEALRPDAVFAEVVHLPEARLGNVLCRPVLREHEISFSGRSAAPADRSIPLADLRVSIAGDRVVLRSERLGREVLPRLTTAHRHDDPRLLGVYRFLCALQAGARYQHGGWSWGPLAAAPRLPRIRHGRVILAPARWRIDADELRGLAATERRGSARYRALQALRRARGLPRYVGLVDGFDEVLFVDLDNVLSAESLVELLRGREHAVLVEALETSETCWVTGPEGRFAHEIIVPFVRARSSSQPIPPPVHATIQRTFPPGSEWLYIKLYTGQATADAVLLGPVAELVREARAVAALDRWHFVRYADPEWHLRIRLRGRPERLLGLVLPSLRERLAPYLEDGRIVRVQLDTYEREVERYGGDAGIELAEAIFAADSDAALAMLEALEEGGPGDDARWRLALRGMHDLLCALGLTLEERLELTTHLDERLGREPQALDVPALAKVFRRERLGLEALLRASARERHHPLRSGLSALARRSRQLAPVVKQLMRRAAEGRLALPAATLAESYLHMFVNRLLASDHRPQERVLIGLLARSYRAEVARGRAGS